MASFYAELHVEGHTYPVVHCNLSFQQSTDVRGRVNAKVRHQPLELLLDVTDGDGLLHWANTPSKPLAGQVVFYETGRRVARETIAFAAGECVHYGEFFESGNGNDGAYRCQVVVTAPAFELRAGGPAAVVAIEAARAAASDLAKVAMGGAAPAGATPDAAGTVASTETSAKTLTPMGIARAVNPEKGTKNCTHIVEAVINRWHGIDPDAVAPDEGVRMLEDVEKIYQTKLSPVDDFYTVFNTINESPEGTIAVVAMGPRVVDEKSMGHIVTIVNYQGKATIIEAQNWGGYDQVETITSPSRAIRRYGDSEETELAFAIIPPPSPRS